MRVALSILAVVIYVLAFNACLYYHGIIPTRYYKITYNLITLFGIATYAIDKHFGIISYLQREFNRILLVCIIMNYLLILATLLLVVSDTNFKDKFYVFNGAIFAVSLMIFISGFKHGLFKKN